MTSLEFDLTPPQTIGQLDAEFFDGVREATERVVADIDTRQIDLVRWIDGPRPRHYLELVERLAPLSEMVLAQEAVTLQQPDTLHHRVDIQDVGHNKKKDPLFIHTDRSAPTPVAFASDGKREHATEILYASDLSEAKALQEQLEKLKSQPSVKYGGKEHYSVLDDLSERQLADMGISIHRSHARDVTLMTGRHLHRKPFGDPISPDPRTWIRTVTA